MKNFWKQTQADWKYRWQKSMTLAIGIFFVTKWGWCCPDDPLPTLPMYPFVALIISCHYCNSKCTDAKHCQIISCQHIAKSPCLNRNVWGQFGKKHDLWLCWRLVPSRNMPNSNTGILWQFVYNEWHWQHNATPPQNPTFLSAWLFTKEWEPESLLFRAQKNILTNCGAIRNDVLTATLPANGVESPY